MAFFTYIVASRRNGTIYTGSTDDLVARVFQHKNKTYPGFTARHGVDQQWNRAWRLELIEKANPGWRDLHNKLRLGALKDAKDWSPPLETDGQDND